MKAPKVKKVRSAAQIAAGIKFAAAGRAAQKGKPRTAAQHAAALKWAAAGRASQAAAKAPPGAAPHAKTAGKVPPVKKAAAMAPAGLDDAGYLWLPGGNDALPSCAAAAVANHRLAATGLAMTEDEILALHRLAGGEDGASVGDILEAMAADGLLAWFWRADPDVIVPGLIVVTGFPRARHAVVACPGAMISWGRVLPWAGEPEEAWALGWTTDDHSLGVSRSILPA